METEYDDDVLDSWRLPNEICIVELEENDGLEGDNSVKKTLPSPLGAIILSNSKRIMDIFIKEVNGFYNNNIYYTDTDNLYIEKKHWDVFGQNRFS